MRVMYSTVTLGGCSGNLNVLLNDINRNFEGSSEFRMRLDGNLSILRVIASILNEMTGPLNLLGVVGKESTSWGTWNSQDSSVRAGTARVKVFMEVRVIGDEERYQWDWDYKGSVWALICVNFFSTNFLFPCCSLFQATTTRMAAKHERSVSIYVLGPSVRFSRT